MRVRNGQVATAVALAVALAVVALVAPGFGLLAALSALIIGALFLLPRVALAFFAAFLVLQPALVNLAGGRETTLGGALQRVDEIILVAGVLRAGLAYATGRMRAEWMWALLTGAFVAAGVISGMINDAPSTVTVLGAFLAAKFPLFFLMGLTIRWTAADARRIVKTAIVAPPIIVVIGLLLLVASRDVRAIFLDPGAAGEGEFSRGGLTAMTAPFSNPGQLGWALACCSAFVVAALSAGTVGAARATTSVGAALFGILASLRRKPLIGLPAAILVGFGAGMRRRQRLYALSASVALLALVGLVARTRIEALVVDTTANYLDPYSPTAARTLLYITGWHIGIAHFPLGVGFGRFGGYISQLRYSPVYEEYGLSTTYGLSPEAPYYMQDTYWPHILGESGWLGVACLALMILLLWRRAMRIWYRNPQPWVRALAFGAAMALVEVVVESAAAPVFEATLFAFFTALPLSAALVIGRASQDSLTLGAPEIVGAESHAI